MLDGALVKLRDRPGILGTLLAVVTLLNIADYSLTLHALAEGAEEANPVMKSLFDLGPYWAGAFKIAAVLLACLLVWRCRRYRRALLTAVIMVVIFAAVLFYHMWGLFVLT